MKNLSLKDIKEEANLLLFQLPGIGLKELELSNRIFSILEEYEKEQKP